MGAVEHLKTLCCLGMLPESAMIAVTPLLHEIIPHGATRLALLAPDATLTNAYAENPATGAIYQHFWRFVDDPTSLASLWNPLFRAVGIGWTLHRQGGAYLQSRYYREIEAPLDSCWILDAMIGDSRRTFAGVQLTRPRSARPFAVDDVQALDRLRPWLAHAFRRSRSGARQGNEAPKGTAGPTVLSGQVILAPDARIVFQTSGLEFLLRILTGEPLVFTRWSATHNRLPAPILKLLRQITGAREWNFQRAAWHAGFDRIWRSYPRSQMARACGHTPRGRREGPEILSHIGDDRTPRTCHCPCRPCLAGKRRDAGPDESRHSARVWQNETCDRG